MAEQRYPMTVEGYKQLEAELHDLQKTKHDRAKKRIAKARSFCDFEEDSEYEEALRAFAAIEDRIATLRYMLQQAKVIQEVSRTVVEIGSSVSIQEVPEGEIEKYRIVGTEETNPDEERISYESPVASALLGAKVNDEVVIESPGGARLVKVISIS